RAGQPVVPHDGTLAQLAQRKIFRFPETGSLYAVRMQTNTTRLNTKQAAEFLGIPEATLRWFRHKGDRGPRSYALTARHVVYDLDDLQTWADAQKAADQRGQDVASRP
ncbi:MAG: helix-turn-helix domain-containing protein, partial [Mycobacterium sp.]|uniref:helix-turn-helix domain-containing protein n=1 Tax=Mycobacterium sp. TaxID=1785 RepID=UPI003F9925E8